MLADVLLDWAFAPFEWIVGLLPTSSLDLSIPAGIPAVSALVASFIDVSAFAGAVVAILAAESFVVGFALLYLLYRKFPGIGPG